MNNYFIHNIFYNLDKLEIEKFNEHFLLFITAIKNLKNNKKYDYQINQLEYHILNPDNRIKQKSKDLAKHLITNFNLILSLSPEQIKYIYNDIKQKFYKLTNYNIIFY